MFHSNLTQRYDSQPTKDAILQTQPRSRVCLYRFQKGGRDDTGNELCKLSNFWHLEQHFEQHIALDTYQARKSQRFHSKLQFMQIS